MQSIRPVITKCAHCETIDGCVCDDVVNHPTHYTAYPMEVIDMIKILLTAMKIDSFEAYCIGNEIKYRMRAGFKGDAQEDINKAMKYKEFREKA